MPIRHIIILASEIWEIPLFLASTAEVSQRSVPCKCAPEISLRLRSRLPIAYLPVKKYFRFGILYQSPIVIITPPHHKTAFYGGVEGGVPILNQVFRGDKWIWGILQKFLLYARNFWTRISAKKFWDDMTFNDFPYLHFFLLSFNWSNSHLKYHF